MGPGTFRFKERRKGRGRRWLERFDRYWGTRPYYQRQLQIWD